MSYTAQSLLLDAILQEMCSAFSMDYQQAYEGYVELAARECVPMIDWNKIPKLSHFQQTAINPERPSMSETELASAAETEAIQEIARSEGVSINEAYQKFFEAHPGKKEWWMS